MSPSSHHGHVIQTHRWPCYKKNEIHLEVCLSVVNIFNQILTGAMKNLLSCHLIESIFTEFVNNKKNDLYKISWL